MYEFTYTQNNGIYLQKIENMLKTYTSTNQVNILMDSDISVDL